MMKRRYLVLFLLIVIAVMLPLSVSAEIQTGKCGDNLKWTLDGNGVLTIAGTGKMYDYEYIEDKNGVESNNIPWGHEIRQVKIQQGVTSIGNFAFEFCKNLTIITIPNSVTTIGHYAFDGCSSLKSITIPDSVTAIGKGTFSECSSLANITIPDSVTSIGDYAFV